MFTLPYGDHQVCAMNSMKGDYIATRRSLHLYYICLYAFMIKKETFIWN